MQRFILASASPQRKWLLEGIGLDFEMIPSSLNETDEQEKDPMERAKVLARLKAEDVAASNPDAYVLGSDTLVVSSDGTLLEKPSDADHAREMLRMHSGSTSTVHSSLCLVCPDGSVSEAMNSSKVTFKELSDDDIEWWISTNEWKDRSGSFQIDGKGQMLISRLDGDWTGVVGLPMHELGKLLLEHELM